MHNPDNYTLDRYSAGQVTGYVLAASPGLRTETDSLVVLGVSQGRFAAPIVLTAPSRTSEYVVLGDTHTGLIAELRRAQNVLGEHSHHSAVVIALTPWRTAATALAASKTLEDMYGIRPAREPIAVIGDLAYEVSEAGAGRGEEIDVPGWVPVQAGTQFTAQQFGVPTGVEQDIKPSTVVMTAIDVLADMQNGVEVSASQKATAAYASITPVLRDAMFFKVVQDSRLLRPLEDLYKGAPRQIKGDLGMLVAAANWANNRVTEAKRVRTECKRFPIEPSNGFRMFVEMALEQGAAPMDYRKVVNAMTAHPTGLDLTSHDQKWAKERARTRIDDPKTSGYQPATPSTNVAGPRY